MRALHLFASCLQQIIRPFTILSRLLPDIWKTHENLWRRTSPLLLVHSRGDTLFPPAMAEELYAAARHRTLPVDLHIFEAHAHNAVYLTVPGDYWEVILAFIARYSSTGDLNEDRANVFPS